jgi:hypothetical protein
MAEKPIMIHYNSRVKYKRIKIYNQQSYKFYKIFTLAVTLFFASLLQIKNQQAKLNFQVSWLLPARFKQSGLAAEH